MGVISIPLLFKELGQAAECVNLGCFRIGEINLLDSINPGGWGWMIIIFILGEEPSYSVDLPCYSWLVFWEELLARKVRLT